MKGLESFQSFAKNKKSTSSNQNNKAVIYTRVSDIRQQNNTSLASQKQLCTEFAIRNQYDICGYFGGTYESAKTDDRKEYKKMLTFVKKRKIPTIIVHSLDRYSRTGGLAIATIEELKKKGIKVISLSQNHDVDTPTGAFMQSFHLLQSKYDNDVRREKTITGMRYRLLNGYFLGIAPIGYRNTRNQQNVPIIVPDENAKFIKKAFYWKINENLSNAEILRRLKLRGLKLYKQRLTEIFRNPVYCGLITHNLLRGEVIQGKHAPIISKKVFLEANNIQAKNCSNFKQKKINDSLPLKTFLICSSCGTSLTGYIVKKKNIHYYKCKTVGCSCNKNANNLHEQFKKLLSCFEIDKKLLPIIKKQLHYNFEHFFDQQKNDKANLKASLKRINEKIERTQERFVLEEINNNLYQKFISKFEKEKAQIQQELENCSLTSSNLKNYVSNCIELFSNLNKIWELSDYTTKQKLQKLLFPNGIIYNKEKDKVRTNKINPIMQLLSFLSTSYNKEKSEQIVEFTDLSALVARTGVEPVTSGL